MHFFDLHTFDVCDCVFDGNVAPVADESHLCRRDVAVGDGVVVGRGVVSSDLTPS